MKFYSPCCGQCKVVAMEFKKNPINVPIEDINVVDNPTIIYAVLIIGIKDIFKALLLQDFS